jgi:hypothetical protein
MVVNRVETLGARLMQYANQIDGGLGIAQHTGDRVSIAHIRLNGMDLADLAKRLQMKREIEPSRGDPDPPASPRQARTTCRPTKPEPPNIVTNRSIFTNSSAMLLDPAAASSNWLQRNVHSARSRAEGQVVV